MKEVYVTLYELELKELKSIEPTQVLIYDSLTANYSVELSTQIANRSKFKDSDRFHIFAFAEPKINGENYDI